MDIDECIRLVEAEVDAAVLDDQDERHCSCALDVHTYRVYVGHYVRTRPDGTLQLTSSSIEDWHKIMTLREAQVTLQSRCEWLPNDDEQTDPWDRAYGRPMRGGWRLGGIATEYREVASSELCSRCGERRSLCGGESNPHE